MGQFGAAGMPFDSIEACEAQKLVAIERLKEKAEEFKAEGYELVSLRCEKV
jgi:hypothetical protein